MTVLMDENDDNDLANNHQTVALQKFGETRSQKMKQQKKKKKA